MSIKLYKIMYMIHNSFIRCSIIGDRRSRTTGIHGDDGLDHSKAFTCANARTYTLALVNEFSTVLQEESLKTSRSTELLCVGEWVMSHKC
jgi:hypothetical protein